MRIHVGPELEKTHPAVRTRSQSTNITKLPATQPKSPLAQPLQIALQNAQLQPPEAEPQEASPVREDAPEVEDLPEHGAFRLQPQKPDNGQIHESCLGRDSLRGSAPCLGADDAGPDNRFSGDGSETIRCSQPLPGAPALSQILGQVVNLMVFEPQNLVNEAQDGSRAAQGASSCRSAPHVQKQRSARSDEEEGDESLTKCSLSIWQFGFDLCERFGHAEREMGREHELYASHAYILISTVNMQACINTNLRFCFENVKFQS